MAHQASSPKGPSLEAAASAAMGIYDQARQHAGHLKSGKFRVAGVDRDTGLETEVMVVASSPKTAKAMGEAKGMIVTSILHVAEDGATPIAHTRAHKAANGAQFFLDAFYQSIGSWPFYLGNGLVSWGWIVGLAGIVLCKDSKAKAVSQQYLRWQLWIWLAYMLAIAAVLVVAAVLGRVY